MKHGGIPGAYGGTQGCGKHGAPFHPLGWFGGHTVIGSAVAGAARGTDAPMANATTVSAVRIVAGARNCDVNPLLDTMELNDNG